MTGSNIQPATPRETAVDLYQEGPPADWGGGQQPEPEEGGGPSLSRYIAAIRRFKWLILVLAAVGLFAGIAASRFIDPEYEVQATILLEQGTGRALITDFGIAWQEPRAGSGTSTPATGEVMGTARYMAPEQALGEVLDGRADLYALGVTLYVAATGRHPYEGRNAIAVMVQQQTQPAASVRQHAPRLPAALADAIDQCLAPAPADRFASAAAFVAAIERSPDGAELAVEARPARAAAQGTLALLDWTFVIALCGVFFVLGESSG